MKFTEEKLERAVTELLVQEGYPHRLGVTIERKPEEVLIGQDLEDFLLRQSPVERDEVYVEIFEQAENFKKHRGRPKPGKSVNKRSFVTCHLSLLQLLVPNLVPPTKFPAMKQGRTLKFSLDELVACRRSTH